MHVSDAQAAAPAGTKTGRAPLALGAALLVLSGAGRGEEVAPYLLTGIDGYATLQYAQDGQTTLQPGEPRSRQTQSGLRNEVFAMTHSYVYHPNFLTLDIGGGPILHSEDYSVEGGAARARGALYNFSGRATLLRDKPYTGSLFYSHLNPSVSVAPGQVFTQENSRYGADFSLLAPASPLPLQTGITRARVRGQGAERTVDDRNDQFNLNVSKSFGALGSTRVQYQASRQTSNSGSANLPIQSSTTRNRAVDVDTRLQLGQDRQYDLTNLVSSNIQDYSAAAQRLPALQDRRLLLDLRARHSDQLQSYGSYNASRSSQGELDAARRSLAAGMVWRPQPGLEAAAGVRADDSDMRQFSSRSRSADGNIRYEQKLPLGVAQISYGARYDQRTQQAQAAQTRVLGESLSLNAAAYVALAHPYAVADSIFVSNAARSQTFVAGIDYLLSRIGAETRLQRLVGGRILDGEQLLVDYAYDVGGSYAVDEFDQSLGLDWSVLRYFNAYVRFFTAEPKLAAGLPTFPLNTVRSRTAGMRADLPFRAGMALSGGGGLEQEERRETVSPYRRVAQDLYLQTDEPLLGLFSARASWRRWRVGYAVATQDSDLHGYELRFWSRQWYGLDLTGSLSAERDDAGLVPRRRVDGSVSLQWQKRRFSLSASLLSTRESQAGIERRRTILQFLAKREF